jgi:outer membrane protein OmpA-like peptidoglycan-associated protein
MSQSVSRLKELLFDHEAQRIADLSRRVDAVAQEASRRDQELATRVDAVFERTGTDDRLTHSVAGVIDGALREAEANKHEQLSSAVAPIVVKTIKYELKNSEAEMVDALYPITGKLVAQYVRAAIADLMADINRRLGGGGLSALEQQARERGVTVAELMLSETQKLAVEELFLIRRGSGALVGHWERERQGATHAGVGSNRDALVAGYISGILRFSQEAFNDTRGMLRTLDLDGERIVLRASQAHVLAARIAGSAPAAVEQAIDATFLEALERHHDALAGSTPAAIMPDVAVALDRRLDAARSELSARLSAEHAKASKPSFMRMYLIAGVVLLPLLLWAASTLFDRWETERTDNAVRAVIASMPEVRGYPLSVNVARGGRSYEISGLLPGEAVRQRLFDQLRNDVGRAVPLDRAVTLPQGGDGGNAAALLRAELTRIEADSVRRSAARVGTRLSSLRAALASAPAGAALSRGDIGAAMAELGAAAAAADTVVRSTQPPAMLPALQQLNTHLAATERILSGSATGTGAAPAPTDAQSAADDALVRAERIAGHLDAIGLKSEIAALRLRLENVRGAPEPGPTERLNAWMRANAVFFANGTDFRDEPAALAQLATLASLLKSTNATIRVVGFTDDRGSQSLNTGLAPARAERVASILVERGVSRERLVVVGRTGGFELSRETGPTSATRRVEFEPTFAGEVSGR